MSHVGFPQKKDCRSTFRVFDGVRRQREKGKTLPMAAVRDSWSAIELRYVNEFGGEQEPSNIRFDLKKI